MALPRLQLIQRLVLCALLLLLLVVMLGTSRLIMMPATALPVSTRHSGRVRSTAEQRLGGRANVTLRSIRLRSEGRLVSGGGVDADAGGGGGGGASTVEALGSPDRPASFSYVVAVLSARGNFARRERIRQHVRRQQQQGTWEVAAAALMSGLKFLMSAVQRSSTLRRFDTHLLQAQPRPGQRQQQPRHILEHKRRTRSTFQRTHIQQVLRC